MTIRLREQFTKRDPTSAGGAVYAVASEVAAPNGGVNMGAMF